MVKYIFTYRSYKQIQSIITFQYESYIFYADDLL